MKRRFLKFLTFTTVFSSLVLATSCSDDDSKGNGTTEPPITEGRWITVAGAIMGTTDGVPGDGNGGTVIYSVSKEDAKDPNKTISVFDNGYVVPSARTARLQSSEDGFTFFNIAYGGGNGGEFSKYIVRGGQNFSPTGGVVSIAQYASANPRWVKLFDGDKTGVAVNVTAPVVKTTEDGTYINTRGTATVLSLDMQNALISATKSYEIALSAAEEAQGHHIFRLDAPVLNKAGNKLIIGTWMRKTNTATGANQPEFEHLGSKSVVVDYPSLENPTIITSTVGFGDTSGYRSFNSFLANDGSIYQATQRDAGGSHILRITENNQYDNNFVFSLDAALGVTNSYIENWRYVGNGIAMVMYTHDGAPESALSGQAQSFIARVDLNAKTAQQIDLPYDPDMYLFQYQGFVVDGYDVYVTLAPVGKDGNIYIINSQTGAVTKGAKLVNKPGNHFIGAF
ncbi:hypothetical protein ACI6PS_01470 [Flavobacterium sp. PLA-1-15]|uniref:hypothetical protein n=1 Tax=Flavobacterium sp. PLA-1-15 TaxID=3380533 RepID=UPI003B7FED09